MIKNGKEFKTAQKIEADLCIVGGGVAGIVLANELLSKFSNIIILEAGGEDYSAESQELYKSNSFPANYRDPMYSRLRFMGGTSNHWLNNTSPLSTIDFEKRDWVPESGWPISFDELNPYYKKAGEYCGVGEDGYATSDMLDLLEQPSIIKDGKYLQQAIAKAATPPTRFYQKHGARLFNSTNVIIITNANVTDLAFDSTKSAVNKVTFESYNNIKHEVEAKNFVLCMGGLENARMLLHFNQKYDNKLGNQYDNVGRYFMEHATVRAAHLHVEKSERFKMFEGVNIESKRIVSFFQLNEEALKKHQVNNLRVPLVPASNYLLSDGISSYHVLLDAVEKGELPDYFGQHIVNTAVDIDMVFEAVSRKSFSKSLFDSAEDFGGYSLPMMIEQTPNRENRVQLSNVKDRFNIPKIDLKWHLSDYDKNMVWKSLEVFAREFGAEGIGRLKLLPERSSRVFGDQMGFGSHHMGTTRMSHSPEKGVVNSEQKVFGTNNLYVAGCSVFTTSGHVPPTLTIAATTIRLAEILSKV